MRKRAAIPCNPTCARCTWSRPSCTRAPDGNPRNAGCDAVVEITGLRNPCGQLDGIQPGLEHAVLDRDEHDNLVRKAGVMSVVIASGVVRPGEIRVELPPPPHDPLEPV